MTTIDPTEPNTPLVGTVRDKPLTSARIITLIAIVVPPLALLSITGLLWGVAVRPVDLITFAVLYVVCGLGITIGFHRLFSHRAFKTTRFMTAVWAILGSMACQGPVTQWVTDHRKHHALSDKEGDPHSPHHGYGGGWTVGMGERWFREALAVAHDEKGAYNLPLTPADLAALGPAYLNNLTLPDQEEEDLTKT